MPASSNDGCLLITGASGHIGRTLIAQFRKSGKNLLSTDISQDEGIIACDLRSVEQVSRLFDYTPISGVVHLAGILPTAFHQDPLAGADLNLTGSLNLLRESIQHKVRRVVFASSVSVYGLGGKPSRPFTEDDPAVPDEAYGGAKRAIEVVGENLSRSEAIEFVALRITRVVGPGVKKTSSPWRAQMFEAGANRKCISIPFARDAELCLVHVQDVARMLVTLAEASAVRHCIYNSPAEIFTLQQLADLLQRTKGVRVETGPDGAYAGATCDGSRFSREFGFQLPRLEDYLRQ
jgi:UDP-glucuronate 4-epimerase